MRRFASIDFLRGLAIFIMLCLHVIMHSLDVNTLLADMNNIAVFQIILLFVLPYLGGMAGFFLMVSAIGNMISMQKFIEKGKDPKELIVRQIVGGFILLIFAMLTEGVIGYQGALGNVFRSLNNIKGGNYDVMYWRIWHFETIHTIAWCIIVNGAIQGLFIMKIGTNFKKLVKSYVFGILIVLILTPIFWMTIGSPYDSERMFYPPVNDSSILEILRAFAIGPLAGYPEPIFPYLASSFMGSIIGLYITQPKKEISMKFLHNWIIAGLILLIIGYIGFIVNIAWVMDTQGIDLGLSYYERIWDHRWFDSEHVPYFGWLFQFATLNGAGILLITSVLRLVEFRGRAEIFAKQTATIRRFGFVAFTVYNCQFIYYIWFYFLSIAITGTPYQQLLWPGTIANILLTLTTFHLIFLAWEKVGYIGSLEWMMGTLGSYLIPGKKQPKNKTKEGEKVNKKKWYERGKLNVQDAFYNAEWINLREADEIDHANFEDSKLALKLAKWGFVFVPWAILAYRMSLKNKSIETDNPYNHKAKNLSIIAMSFNLIMLAITTSTSLSTYGLTL